jgi:20S proteasome subunit beta 7
MQHSKQPIVTGTSVLGIKYNGGVLLAADTLCSYGSMAKYKNAERLRCVSDSCIIGAGGEYSDFQFLMDELGKKAQQEANEDDGAALSAEQYWNYLRAVMYQRRSKMNPLWNDVIIAGPKFLGFVDKIGTTFQDDFIATGFGSYLSLPILRNKWRADLTEGEARTILEDCLRVLFYRDCRALNRIQIAKVTEEGSVVSEGYDLETEWSSASMQEPKGGMEGEGGW